MKKEQETKLSIVIPVYNMAGYIEDTLKSLEYFEGKVSYEVIVQNALSKDGTTEIVERYCQKYPHWYHFNEKDAGQSDAINRGTARSIGKWVSWICADDILLPGLLDALNEAEENHADVFYGDVVLLQEGTYYPANGTESYSDGALARRRLIIQQPGTFVRRSIWEELNGVNTDLNWTMDYDFYLRVESKGYKFYRSNVFVSLARIHPEAKTSSGSVKRLLEYFRILLSAHIRRPRYFRLTPYLVYKLEFFIKYLEAFKYNPRGKARLLGYMHRFFWLVARDREGDNVKDRFARLDPSIYKIYKD